MLWASGNAWNIQLMQFIDPHKVAKKWLPVEVDFCV